MQKTVLVLRKEFKQVYDCDFRDTHYKQAFTNWKSPTNFINNF